MSGRQERHNGFPVALKQGSVQVPLHQVPLDAQTLALIPAALVDPFALQVALLGRCWPVSPWTGDELFDLHAGETLDQGATRHDILWSPQWLMDAGHEPFDAGGTPLSGGQAATVAGPMKWQPAVLLPKVDDNVKDDPGDTPKGSEKHRKRLAGEVALAALWRRSAQLTGIPDTIRPFPNLSGGARGNRFRNALAHYLQGRCPDWNFYKEKRLSELYGLHLRRDVGKRSADIVVLDDEPRPRLMVLVSSKWTWRSDRGTEAAQKLVMMKYRPQVPYVLVTAEFPRLYDIESESVEDRTFHLCPLWAGCWTAVYEMIDGGEVPREVTPNLAHLESAGSIISNRLGIQDLTALGTALKTPLLG